MKIRTPFPVLLAVIFLAGCSSSIEDYSPTSPRFSLKSYFDRPMAAWGVLQDYSNKMTRRFCVVIEPTWQGNQGTLDEAFYFADGELQTRIWEIEQAANGDVSGRAGDVIDTAYGETSGSVFHWTYTLRLALDDSELDVFMDDWMFQLDQYRLMNRTYMKKFGITVAELSIFFDKSAPIASCDDFIEAHNIEVN